ncbi:MAG TPA: glucose 1-dehydrogenase [Lunatimonas sp.]|nr:glucose 1-dehydrogenase [Lunatimonas sp.]
MKTNQHRKLHRQTAIVTGASSGIGQAIAVALAEAGANVAVNYHSDVEGAEETQSQIEAVNGNCILVKADISKEHDVKRLFYLTKEAYGDLHILISNAGIQKDSPFLEMAYEDWDVVIKTNLYGAFMSANAAAKAFVSQFHDAEVSAAAGKIVFISSVHDTIPWSGRVNYATSKGGTKMLMQSIAQELAPHKIRVNSISPGAIKTPINEDQRDDEEEVKQMLAKIPYGRIGKPEEIGKAVCWLVSDEADYVTGATLYIDGGMTLYPSFGEG